MTSPRLVYVSEAKIPSRSSNSIQTMRMCAAFAAAGADVTLVHPRYDGPPAEGVCDPESFYAAGGFCRRVLPVISTRRVERAGPLGRPMRAAVLGSQVLRLASSDGILFTRSHLVARLAVDLRRLHGRLSFPRIFIELHDEPPTAISWSTLRHVDGVVVTTNALRERIASQHPQLAGRITVEHAGVETASFRPELDREAARRQVGIEGGRGPLIVYTGRVTEKKGAGVLLAAAAELTEQLDARVVLVGRVYDESLENVAGVHYTGFVPPAQVPPYLAAADVLVMPSTEALAYAAYTSPLKLAEYMAAGRPVVASNLPSVKEVLIDGRNALLYPPDDPAALAAAVRRLWADRELATRLAAQARRDVERRDWTLRAERILCRMTAPESIRLSGGARTSSARTTG